MSDRIEEYIARQDIYQLVCRYMRGLDRLDRGLLISVFHPDAWCEYGFWNSGAEEFVDFALGALREHDANQHLVGNTIIDVEGNEAFGEVYFQAYHKVTDDTGSNDIIIAGRYLDRYECRDGEWKFSYRSERVDWSRTTETRDVYFDMAPDCLRGGRQDDAVYRRDNRVHPAVT